MRIYAAVPICLRDAFDVNRNYQHVSPTMQLKRNDLMGLFIRIAQGSAVEILVFSYRRFALSHFEITRE